MTNDDDELDIVLPSLGESVAVGRLVRWLKRPGERVAEGEALCEIETDKIALEIPSPAEGVLVAVLAPEDSEQPIGARLATLSLSLDGAHPYTRVEPPLVERTPPRPEPPTPARAPTPEARTLVVIGGGLAGFAAARRASTLGRRVVLIDEREQLGGYELHEGSYLRAPWLDAARRVAEARQDLAPRGLRCSVELDLPTLREHAEASLRVWQQGLAFLLRRAAITHRKGRARVVEPGVVELADERMTDVDVVLAGGPSLVAPDGIVLDGERIVALGRAAAFTQVPARLLVIGSSVEALEWAGIWQQLGARVTLALDGPITPEPELDAKWLRELGRVGMRIVSARPSSLVRIDDEVEAELGEGTRERFDRVLVECVPDPHDETPLVDVGGRTAQVGVWAVGGVTGTRWPAEAIAEGWMVGERLADAPGWTPLVRETIPRVILGPVELAWVGPSKAQLDARGIPTKLGGFPAIAHVRARLAAGSGSTRGFVHVLAHAGSGRVLAARAMGPGAAELVSEAASAITMGASIVELGRIPRSPSSWAFGLGEAARAVHGFGLLL